MMKLYVVKVAQAEVGWCVKMMSTPEDFQPYTSGEPHSRAVTASLPEPHDWIVASFEVQTPVSGFPRDFVRNSRRSQLSMYAW